jgi:hypothetical protein
LGLARIRRLRTCRGTSQHERTAHSYGQPARAASQPPCRRPGAKSGEHHRPCHLSATVRACQPRT